ncbi:hypothetical protein [Nonomuraea bangladeshensis]|uniref:hypothetical protein n=1 Tax=Nonomuraea bangladeshensis TaxID=404385 RepID=UPI0031DEADFA
MWRIQARVEDVTPGEAEWCPDPVALHGGESGIVSARGDELFREVGVEAVAERDLDDRGQSEP